MIIFFFHIFENTIHLFWIILCSSIVVSNGWKVFLTHTRPSFSIVISTTPIVNLDLFKIEWLRVRQIVFASSDDSFMQKYLSKFQPSNFKLTVQPSRFLHTVSFFITLEEPDTPNIMYLSLYLNSRVLPILFPQPTKV